MNKWRFSDDAQEELTRKQRTDRLEGVTDGLEMALHFIDKAIVKAVTDEVVESLAELRNEIVEEVGVRRRTIIGLREGEEAQGFETFTDCEGE